MRIDTKSDKIYLSIKDEYGKIINQPILVIAKTGGGKGLILEFLAEDYHNNDCVVIAIADPKQNCELALNMFPPEEEYHLRNLKAIGKKPEAKKVKIYHPVVLNLDTKNYLPNYNFYTIPIKELGGGEWSLLAETHSKSDSVTILESASSLMSNEDGWFGFADKLAFSIQKQKSKKKDIGKNFSFLSENTSLGTIKDLGKIKGYLQQFEQFGFLGKVNSKYNLDWNEILNDQEYYHVFVTNFIDRTKYKKIIGFIILNLIQSIIRNKKLLKKHLVILIPEMKNLTPFKPQGFEEFLADAFTQAISTVRSAGISIVGDTQVWVDIDKRTRDVFKVNLMGELNGDDIDEVCKKFGFGREYKEFLRKPPKRNSFILAESDNFQPFTFFLPSAMHKEPIPGKYNFENMYKKYSRKDSETYPMKNYKSLIKEIREEINLEKKKYIDKAKKKVEEEEIEEQRKIGEKESKQTKDEKVEQKVEKAKEIQDKSKEMLMKLCWEMYHNANLDKREKTYRKIADKFKDMGVKTHVTAKKYIELWDEKLKKEESKDFEDDFIESEGGDEDE